MSPPATRRRGSGTTTAAAAPPPPIIIAPTNPKPVKNYLEKKKYIPNPISTATPVPPVTTTSTTTTTTAGPPNKSYVTPSASSTSTSTTFTHIPHYPQPAKKRKPSNNDKERKAPKTKKAAQAQVLPLEAHYAPGKQLKVKKSYEKLLDINGGPFSTTVLLGDVKELRTETARLIKKGVLSAADQPLIKGLRRQLQNQQFAQQRRHKEKLEITRLMHSNRELQLRINHLVAEKDSLQKRLAHLETVINLASMANGGV